MKSTSSPRQYVRALLVAAALSLLSGAAAELASQTIVDTTRGGSVPVDELYSTDLASQTIVDTTRGGSVPVVELYSADSVSFAATCKAMFADGWSRVDESEVNVWGEYVAVFVKVNLSTIED